MKCFVVLATLVAAVSAEAVAEADAGYFGGYGNYGYSGYGHHGYARPLLASSYSAHSYHPSPAYHGGYAAAAYTAAAPVAHHVSYPAVPAAPYVAEVAAPAAYAPAPYASAAIAAPAPYAPAAIAAPAPYAHTAIATAPVAVAAPYEAVAPAAPIGSTSSQFHSQDEFGNYDYSYSNINSAKHESGNAYTGVMGSYSYVDGHGLPQRVEYVADNLGFRATGTNFPTTAANLGLHRRRRQILATPYASPLLTPTVSAPAAREAILTRIQLNPGHAVAYRVF